MLSLSVNASDLCITPARELSDAQVTSMAVGDNAGTIKNNSGDYLYADTFRYIFVTAASLEPSTKLQLEAYRKRFTGGVRHTPLLHCASRLNLCISSQLRVHYNWNVASTEQGGVARVRAPHLVNMIQPIFGALL